MPNASVEPLGFSADRVAVRVRVLARGVGSRVEVDVVRRYVFDVRDGKVARFASFDDPLEALDAVRCAE